MKYPRTPYWPYSPTIGRGDAVHSDPERFVGCPVVVTEKLDGSNVLIHRGKVYGRSVAAESTNKWMAMVKKHHSWKVTEPDAYLYGEDLYGVHSIQYAPVRETETSARACAPITCRQISTGLETGNPVRCGATDRSPPQSCSTSVPSFRIAT